MNRLTKTIVKFFNSKFVEDNSKSMMALWGGVIMLCIGHTYYYHFTNGLDSYSVTRLGKKFNLAAMYILPPMTNEDINTTSLYQTVFYYR